MPVNDMKNHKTNAARILDREGIPYRLVGYEVDDEDLSAVHLAEQLGLDINRIFKTLVLRGDKSGHLVCVIPGGRELDLKKAAKASGNKSCAMIPVKDLQSVTGYIRGGCSPIGMKRRFPAYLHQTALAYPDIHVSAGLRGLQLVIAPEGLVKATGAEVADLVME